MKKIIAIQISTTLKHTHLNTLFELWVNAIRDFHLPSSHSLSNEHSLEIIRFAKKEKQELNSLILPFLEKKLAEETLIHDHIYRLAHKLLSINISDLLNPEDPVYGLSTIEIKNRTLLYLSNVLSAKK